MAESLFWSSIKVGDLSPHFSLYQIHCAVGSSG
jgi:hypothetical protein